MKTIFLILGLSLLFAGCEKQVTPAQSTHVDGVKNGIETKYGYNRKGEVSSVTQIPYVNGLKHGKEVRKSSKGNIYMTIDFVNGKKDGYYTQYNKNGSLYLKSQYKDGRQNGVSKKWYDNGNLQTIEHYKDGRQNGITKTYYEDGGLISTFYFKDGRIVSEKESKRFKRKEAQIEKEQKAFDKKQAEYKRKSSQTNTNGGAVPTKYAEGYKITNNDGRFISGVCSDSSTFFIEHKGRIFEGSGTNGVCNKTTLNSTISCVCGM